LLYSNSIIDRLFSFAMIIDNFLLPRFLILELVFACHYLQFARARSVLRVARVGEEVDGDGFKEAVEHGGEAIDNSHGKRQKIVPKKGLIGLKNVLLRDHTKIDELTSDPERGLKGLKKVLNREDNSQNINVHIYKEELTEAAGGLQGLKSDLHSSPVCEVSLEDQEWRHQPLLYNVSGIPILPLSSSNKMKVRVVQGEVITLSCPGSKVNRTKVSKVLLKCVQGDNFTMNSSILDIAELGCTKNPKEKEVLDHSASRCGPDMSGQISQLGFLLNKVVTPLVTVCHTVQGEVTHYTNHTLLGSLLHTRRVPDYRPNFKEGPVYFTGVSANSAYKQSHQKRLFTDLFGKSEVTDFFQPDEGLYLARGHLTPTGDLLYKDWQELSYMYSNVVPQWQVVNNGNWRDVEEAVRARAVLKGSNMQVFTGTKGVLRLRGKELWLVKKSIPVPKYLWKLVVDKVSEDSIVFVTLNNPHLIHLTRSVTLCKDVCEETGWGERLKDKEVVGQGYTQCCDPKQFREKVPWLPIIGREKLLVF